MSRRETTILGVTYAGRPRFNSDALSIMCAEHMRGPEAAQALLDALNHIRRCFGQQPIDLAAEMTDVPMEGGITLPARGVPPIAPRMIAKCLKDRRAAA